MSAGKWVTPVGSRSAALTSDSLAQTPDGTCLAVLMRNIVVTVRKVEGDRWVLHGRGVHSRALDGLLAAPRERRATGSDDGWAT